MGSFNIKYGVLEAFRKVFRPLVKILLRNGISFSEFSETTQEIFIEESIKDAWARGGNCSVARIAICTGIPRSTVERIVGAWAEDAEYGGRNRSARITRLLTGWSTDPRYVGPYGWPMDVPYEPRSDAEPQSFVDLVTRYSGNTSPQQMLTELLEGAAIRQLGSGLFRLENRAYIIPEAQTNESLNRFSMVVSNVIRTLDHNMQVESERDGLFERTAAADLGLGPRNLPTFDAFLRETGPGFLEELDAWMSSHPPGADEERVGTGVGVYMYVEHEIDNLNPSEFGLRNPNMDRLDS